MCIMGPRQAEIYLSSVKVLPFRPVCWMSPAGTQPPPNPGIHDLWLEGEEAWLWDGVCWLPYRERQGA
jgi:hypothetical protein